MGWDDKSGDSDQGKACGPARDIVLSSPTLKQVRGLFQPGLQIFIGIEIALKEMSGL